MPAMRGRLGEPTNGFFFKESQTDLKTLPQGDRVLCAAADFYPRKGPPFALGTVEDHRPAIGARGEHVLTPRLFPPALCLGR
jgi:hypothetical protein